MTYVNALSAGLLVIGFGLAAGHAEAGAIPPLWLKTAAPLVQKADYWHRYYRQHTGQHRYESSTHKGYSKP